MRIKEVLIPMRTSVCYPKASTMSINTKTPVMVLQELAVKHKLGPPTYDLIVSRMGSQDNEFQYLVSIEKFSAVGKGRSKQSAKHMAAQNILQIISESGRFGCLIDPNHTFDVALHRNEPVNFCEKPVNHIGVLQDICLLHKINFPIFYEISDVGPPHNRVFTYECHVASMRSDGMANTKKQAKQLAAKEMISRLSLVLEDVSQECAAINRLLDEKDLLAVTKYKEIVANQEVVVPNKATLVEDYHKTLMNIVESSNFEPKDFLEYVERGTEESLREMMEKLELKFNWYPIVVETDDNSIIYSLTVAMETSFTVLGYGNTEEQAKEMAVKNAFDLIKEFLDLEQYK